MVSKSHDALQWDPKYTYRIPGSRGQGPSRSSRDSAAVRSKRFESSNFSLANRLEAKHYNLFTLKFKVYTLTAKTVSDPQVTCSLNACNPLRLWYKAHTKCFHSKTLTKAALLMCLNSGQVVCGY